MLDPANILLLRHGRTDWNDQGRLQGRTDIPLNAEGVAGVRRAAAQLAAAGVKHVLTSPLGRATQTATIIAEALAIPVSADPRLIERDFGILEGRFLADIRKQHDLGEDFSCQPVLPGGAEAWDTVQSRMLAAYHEALCSPAPVLIVSHLAALTALAKALGRAAPPKANAVPFSFSSTARENHLSQTS